MSEKKSLKNLPQPVSLSNNSPNMHFLYCHWILSNFEWILKFPVVPSLIHGFPGRVRNAGQSHYKYKDPELPLVRVTLFLKTFWFSPGLLVTRIEQNIVGYCWNHFALGFCLLKLGRTGNKNDKIFWKVHLYHYQDLPYDLPPFIDWKFRPKLCWFKIKSFMICVFLLDNPFLNIYMVSGKLDDTSAKIGIFVFNYSQVCQSIKK